MKEKIDCMGTWLLFIFWLLFVYTPIGIGLLFFGGAVLISRIAQ